MSAYMIAAGGTGGHIYPGIAIADKIREKEPEAAIIFCGTSGGMENKIIPGSGYELVHISAIGFDFRSLIKTIKALYSFFKGTIQSIKIIRERKVDVVVGTGGYVCGPAVFAASLLKKVTVLHEQNAFPGMANRRLSKRADIVCASFNDSIKYFPSKAKVVVTGNPVRSSFKEITKEEARKRLKFDPSERVIFATGGSLGARSINNAVTTLAEEYLSIGYRIILASGKRDYDDLIRRKRMPDGIFEIRDYISEQHLYLAAADVVICRAGAITCAEIAVLGKPSIMVPYPYAAGDHQTLNAKAFEESGACVLIPDDKLNASALYSVLGRIITDREKLTRMGKAALTMAFPNAASDIYEQIILLKNG